jgi:hypothetical protein
MLHRRFKSLQHGQMLFLCIMTPGLLFYAWLDKGRSGS